MILLFAQCHHFLARSNQLKLAGCDVPMCSDVDLQPVLPVDDVLVQ